MIETYKFVGQYMSMYFHYFMLHQPIGLLFVYMPVYIICICECIAWPHYQYHNTT